MCNVLPATSLPQVPDGSSTQSDTGSLALKIAKNGLGKVAFSWSYSVFSPSDNFIMEVKDK